MHTNARHLKRSDTRHALRLPLELSERIHTHAHTHTHTRGKVMMCCNCQRIAERCDGCETEDSIEADDWDERNTAGSVQGLQLVFAAWREIPANVVKLAGAFDNWKWCVRTAGLSEDENHSDNDGDSGEDHGSDDAHSETDRDSDDDQDADHAGDSGADDCPEPIKHDWHQQKVALGPLNPAGGLACGINTLTSALASLPK